MGHAGERPLQLREPFDILEEVPQDHDLPPAADEFRRRFRRACPALSHRLSIARFGIRMVTAAPEGAFLFSSRLVLSELCMANQDQNGSAKERREGEATMTIMTLHKFGASAMRRMRLSLRQTDMSGAREFQQKEWRGSDGARVRR
ncbi:MAG: hypothetical protein OJF51_001387 [Nitrospira sp.]|nr:MAG: hypothetical protein OJF51_001387 [Nitrospira sp.]